MTIFPGVNQRKFLSRYIRHDNETNYIFYKAKCEKNYFIFNWKNISKQKLEISNEKLKVVSVNITIILIKLLHAKLTQPISD